jgi:hypothetical protein
MPQGTLCVPALKKWTQSVPGCIPTRSVGTIPRGRSVINYKAP